MRKILPLSVLLVLACSDGVQPHGPPVSMSVVSGGAQRHTVTRELPDPVVVEVLDAQSRPVQNQIINWKIVEPVSADGGGSVYAGVSITNTQGHAREYWTLGNRAGTQVLEGVAVDSETGAKLVLERIEATADPDTAWTFNLTPDWDTRFPVSVGDTVEVRFLIKDRHGNVTQLCTDIGSVERNTWGASDTTVVRYVGQRWETVRFNADILMGRFVATAIGTTWLTASSECVPWVGEKRTSGGDYILTIQ